MKLIHRANGDPSAVVDTQKQILLQLRELNSEIRESVGKSLKILIKHWEETRGEIITEEDIEE